VLALGMSEFLDLHRWEEASKPRAGCGWPRRHSSLATPMPARCDIGTSLLAPRCFCWRSWSCGKTGSWAALRSADTARD